ncbi:hypothetical protein EPR50_G00046240 [Perca flavescens]|uniref:Uncharacterized protein n=1 Tax=Perca flavescens TaxID=8167 RepID=A0A484DCP0_PERFV|nr:hypothetical protein EPR50_G00046240 [Perca flavescens]
MCRMELIPRIGIYTPIIPVGMTPGQLIMDTAPTKHPASMLETFPPTLENVYTAYNDLAPRWFLLGIGRRLRFSTVTVKDEGPCGRGRHCAMETGGTGSTSGSQHRALRAGRSPQPPAPSPQLGALCRGLGKERAQ